jgi:hypothetical protein
MKKSYDWIIFAILIGTVIGSFTLVTRASKSGYEKRDAAPCESFKNDSVKDVPARCLKYFKE